MSITKKIGPKLINSFLKGLPVVKYKSNGSFGLIKAGSLIDAHLISDEGYKALLYFSTNFRNDECGTFIICKRKYKYPQSKNFVYVDSDEDSWVNLL